MMHTCGAASAVAVVKRMAGVYRGGIRARSGAAPPMLGMKRSRFRALQAAVRLQSA
jgi:hypothetical protein